MNDADTIARLTRERDQARRWARAWKRAARDERERRALLGLAHLALMGDNDRLRGTIAGALLYAQPMDGGVFLPERAIAILREACVECPTTLQEGLRAAAPPKDDNSLAWDETRCRICGWPLDPEGKMCTSESCSMRPRPRQRADGRPW